MLFTPFQLGRITLPNRIVMSPMTRSRAPGSVPNAQMARYYALRATAGLIVTEGTSPSQHGLGYTRIPGAFSADQTAGWRLVTEGTSPARRGRGGARGPGAGAAGRAAGGRRGAGAGRAAGGRSGGRRGH